MKIAGLRTASDWQELSAKLKTNPTNELWQEAFKDFLGERIKTRYYDPIEAITQISAREGKGFSIIAIYCTLIEFFEVLLKGYHYVDSTYEDASGNIIKSQRRTDKKGNPCNLSSGDVFVQFLTENEPFKSQFSTNIAEGFYKHVRCSILHQAETSGGWTIRDGEESDAIVHRDLQNPPTITIRWKPLKKAFAAFLSSYEKLLATEQSLQTNFILKWDRIART